jgi:type II secretory pathway pseudopilin PulG
MIRRSSHQHRAQGVRGFSLVELVIVLAIAMIVMGMAVPGIRRSLQYYALRSAVTSVSGAIQSARYQAIFHGCKYQLVFTAASYSYTVANQIPAAGNSTCTGVYGPASAAIPLMGRGVALAADTTMQFLPNGTIATVPSTSPMTLGLNYAGSGLLPETITVSTYGKINVAP